MVGVRSGDELVSRPMCETRRRRLIRFKIAPKCFTYGTAWGSRALTCMHVTGNVLCVWSHDGQPVDQLCYFPAVVNYINIANEGEETDFDFCVDSMIVGYMFSFPHLRCFVSRYFVRSIILHFFNFV